MHDPSNPNSIVGNAIRNLFEDSNGLLWIGTEWEGMSSFNYETNTFKQYRHSDQDENSLINDYVRTFYEDHNKNIWIGTAQGISIFNKEKDAFYPSPVNDLLPDLVINGIIQDDENVFWISTNRGVSQYNAETSEINHYDSRDGLQGNEFSYGAIMKSSMTGDIYFGGNKGFSILSPDKVKKSEASPKVVISSFKLFDKKVSMGDTINDRVLLENSITGTEEIVLNHSENVFALEFSALDFMAPEKNLYKFQMEGFDQSETLIDANNRKATYTNLDPGDYTFKVRASNSDEVWSNNYTTMKITILPAWWNTIWFRMILLLLVIAIGYGLYIWRVRTIKSQKVFLQQQIEEKTSELKKMIEVIKANNQYIEHSGEDLKIKSGVLLNDAKTQSETAQTIQSDIESVTNYAKKNNDNARLTHEISSKTVAQLEKIRIATENNVSENKAIIDKLSVLEEIFRQTNILAINASIEAASAGDFGGGFAVIAREVRRLAEKSREASDEIHKYVEKGVTETEEVGKMILDFIPEFEKSATLMKEISDASEVQTSSIENVTESLNSFFKISNQNAGISNEIYDISSELDSLVKYLKEKLSEFSV